MPFEKTQAGQQEITGRQRALSSKQRQLLIMVDGKRTMDDLTRHLAHLNVPEMMHELEQLGYIHASKDTITDTPDLEALTSLSASKSIPSAMTQDQLAAIKIMLVSTTKKFMGDLAEPLVIEIKALSTEEQVKSFLVGWQTQIQASRMGETAAQILVDEILNIASARI